MRPATRRHQVAVDYARLYARQVEEELEQEIDDEIEDDVESISDDSDSSSDDDSGDEEEEGEEEEEEEEEDDELEDLEPPSSTPPPAASTGIGSSPIATDVVSIPTSIPVPTSFETRTNPLPTATAGASDDLLPGQGPVRGGAENAESSLGATETTPRMDMIAGAVLGTVGAVALIGLLVFCLLKRRRRKQSQDATDQVFGASTTRSQKSHSRILDQVMAAFYRGHSESGSVRGEDTRGGAHDPDWFPEKQPGHNNIPPPEDPSNKPFESVRLWVDKIGSYAPTIRASRVSATSDARPAWTRASMGPDGRYPEINDDYRPPLPRDAPSLAPSAYPPMPGQPLASQPAYPPMVAQTEGTARYTINSNSTWYRWG